MEILGEGIIRVSVSTVLEPLRTRRRLTDTGEESTTEPMEVVDDVRDQRWSTDEDERRLQQTTGVVEHSIKKKSGTPPPIVLLMF